MRVERVGTTSKSITALNATTAGALIYVHLYQVAVGSWSNTRPRASGRWSSAGPPNAGTTEGVGTARHSRFELTFFVVAFYLTTLSFTRSLKKEKMP